MQRAFLFWAAVPCVLSCSSSSHKGNSSIASAGSNVFGNATTPAAGRSGQAGQAAGQRGTGGSGVGSTATGTGTGPSNGKCAEGTAHGGHVTPRVILVLDGSCSMSTNYPSDGQRDSSRCSNNPNGRWAAMRNALIAPQNGVVATLQGGVEFGVAVFGTQPMCPIPATPVDPALNNLAAISAALPAVQPGMYTPTGLALSWVYDNMFTVATAPDAHPGPQLVILATDGEPNSCNSPTTDFQPSIDAVTQGQMKGIKTYVISLAAASGQFHDHLQQLANIGANEPAGSNAPLYEPSTPADLAADLELLVGGAVGCELALSGSVLAGRECEGTVMLNGQALTCNNADGWILSDPRHVRLQGAACDKLKQSADALLDARFPCDVWIVQ